MKHPILFALLLLTALSIRGQMTQWTIQPKYDTIYVKEKEIIQGENNGDNILWTMDGKMLFATPKRINTFSDGVATIQNRNSSAIEGFINTNGELIELQNAEVAYGYPYFEDGFLVAKKGEKYALYNKEGKSVELPPLQTLYPYSNEFATYYAYQNPEKEKNPFFSLLLSDGNPIKNFIIKDKEKDKTKIVEPKDISFMSSVDGNTGKALAIIKNKLYWFDTFENSLLPILMEDSNQKTKQLELESNKALGGLEFPCDSLTIVAKCGKDQTMEFRFDKMLRLLPKYVSASSSNNTLKHYLILSYPTELTVYKENHQYGLEFNNQYSVPAQFGTVGLRYGNRALVKKDGHWGVIEIIPDCDYSLQLNGGNDLQFKHHIAKSSLQINLPSRITSDNVTVETPYANGLRLDTSSRENKTMQGENTISYICILDAPEALADTIKDMSYGPIEISVDGVRLPSRMVNAKSIYVNPFIVSISDPNAEVAMGKATFDLLVGCDNESGIQAAPFEVSVASESLPAMVEKISDNFYRCTVDNLQSGLNDITVKVTEKNCPSSEFPIKITYSKVGKKETATVRVLTLEDLLNEPKRIVFDDGDIVGKIIANNAPLYSGPGLNFPKSSYYSEYLGKVERSSPFKGERLKLKEIGDWYLISEDMTEFDASKSDRGYISKKYVKPVESAPFSFDEKSESIAYYRINEEKDDMGEIGYFPEVIAIYPDGLYVKYAGDFYSDAYIIGTLMEGNQAFLAEYLFDASCLDSNLDSNTAIPIIEVGPGLAGVGLCVQLPSSGTKTVAYKRQNIDIPDFSVISESQWREALRKAKAYETFNEHGSNIINPNGSVEVLTKDDLEKNYKRLK